jgi:hypothetical protein
VQSCGAAGGHSLIPFEYSLQGIYDHNSTQGELSKDCLRAMVKGLTTYHSLAGVEGCAKFTHFYKQILATKVLQELLTQMSSK